MNKSLWLLNDAGGIPSVAHLQEWLKQAFLPYRAILAYQDPDKRTWQQWTINRRGINAPAILLLETDKLIDFDTVWPSYLSVAHGYHLKAHEVMPVEDITANESYPFVLQISGFVFNEAIIRPEAIKYWQKEHTAIACQHQTTVGYTQNVVIGQSPFAPDIDGWVEEAFPEAAMQNPLLFFAAETPQQMQQHIDAIVSSSSKFIAMDSLFVQHYCAIKLI